MEVVPPLEEAGFMHTSYRYERERRLMLKELTLNWQATDKLMAHPEKQSG